MKGDDRSRWCGTCSRDIPNLSMLTAAEQRRWFAGAERPPCVRSEVGRDGWLKSADGGQGLPLELPIPRLGLTLGLALGASAALALPAMTEVAGSFATAPPAAETRGGLDAVGATGAAPPEGPAESLGPSAAPTIDPEMNETLSVMGYL